MTPEQTDGPHPAGEPVDPPLEGAPRPVVDEPEPVEDRLVHDSRVADAVARLDNLGDAPPAEHVEVYEDVHRVLQDALAEAARGDRQQ